MNGYGKKIAKLVMLGFTVVLFQACSVKMPVDAPDASESSYHETGKSKEIKIKFESNLKEDHQVAAGNKTNVFVLEHNNEKIDADEYVKLALQKEIVARELPLQFMPGANDKLTLEHFEIITHRVSAYSPLVTVSTLRVDMKIEEESKTFVSVVKRAKTPVWSMGEVIEPCYNEPTTLLIKEIVAKINKNYFNHKLNDQYIEELKRKISTEENKKLTYLDVYELGFSNNPNALEFLKALTSSSDEYIRLAAISSVGILGDKEQFEFLTTLNKNSKMWQDRAMALKSIGDLDTQASDSYLKERKEFWQGKTTTEAIWNLKIINLYIQ